MKHSLEKCPLVKQQLSFLNYPIWFQGQQKGRERNSDGELVLRDIDGYIYRAGYKLPNEVDILFLYYLLLRSQQEGYKQKMEFTRYEILKDCAFPDILQNYDRLEDSLRRWKNVSLEFKGTFYDDKKYLVISFGIINDYKIREEDKKLEIEFNRHWLLKIKNTPSFKLINFLYIKALRRPLSRRLFEYLSPKFYQQNSFKLGLVLLGNKLALTGRKVETTQEVKYVIYASDVLMKIKGAVGEINKLAKNHKLMGELGIKQEEAFDVTYEIDGKGNERNITFYKKPIEDYKPKKRRGKRGKLPFQIVREEAIPKSTDQQYQEALTWIKSVPGFHKGRLKDIEKLPPEDVVLAYPYIRSKYTEGKKKGPGWVYDVFTKKWYLKKAKKAIVEKQKQKEEEKKQKAERKQREKETRKREETAKMEEKRVRSLIDKYGGREHARYKGYEIVMTHIDFGLAIKEEEGRKCFPLDEVQEKYFSTTKI